MRSYEERVHFHPPRRSATHALVEEYIEGLPRALRPASWATKAARGAPRSGSAFDGIPDESRPIATPERSMGLTLQEDKHAIVTGPARELPRVQGRRAESGESVPPRPTATCSLSATARVEPAPARGRHPCIREGEPEPPAEPPTRFSRCRCARGRREYCRCWQPDCRARACVLRSPSHARD
jgi:hypothetical protein